MYLHFLQTTAKCHKFVDDKKCETKKVKKMFMMLLDALCY